MATPAVNKNDTIKDVRFEEALWDTANKLRCNV